MANASGVATVFNCPNYVGELFLVGQNQTPFLNKIGGLHGSNAKQTKSWEFPVAQTWDLEAASQPDISESDSQTAPTATTYVRGQDKNVCQIFQRAVKVTYARQSDIATLSGLAVAGDNQPVMDEKTFQIQAALKQVAVDVEYTLINGAYQVAANSTQANKTRGIMVAVTTNTVDADEAALTDDQVKELLRTMAANGAMFQNMVIGCNAFQRQAISELYGFAPASTGTGGVAVDRLYTDFGAFDIMYIPKMPTDAIGFFDFAVIAPVFLAVPAKGYLFYEELAKTGAAENGQIYGQLGLAYGPEEMHGTITGLKDS